MSNSDTVVYVKRLTRKESQEATRERLIAAAGKAFIKYGFEGASVERIAEEAGFSRGAFYSNFRSKDELFIAVLKARHDDIEGVLDEIVNNVSDPAKRLLAVLDWYVNHEVNQGWIILESEFTLRACRNRAARARLAEFNEQRIAHYAELVAKHFRESGTKPTGRPAAVAMSLFAAAKGLAELGLFDSGTNHKKLHAECRDLIFKHLIPEGSGSS